MKICLNCETEFYPKRDRAKFCSDLCRATFNQKVKTNNLRFKIYSLSDPISKEVFYIGKTISNLELRLQDHISKSKTSNSLKSNKINEILNNGWTPIISMIEEYKCASEKEEIEINKRENYWIDFYKKSLCNVEGVEYNYRNTKYFKKTFTGILNPSQNVVLNIPEEVVDKYQSEADKDKRSRKNLMEKVLIDYFETTQEEATSEKPKSNGTMTLNKIKDSCPKELTGLARSNWIFEERKKYGL